MPSFRLLRTLPSIFVVLGGASGCVGPDSTRCADTVCPPGSICYREFDPPRCVLPAELAACEDTADGAPCTVSEDQDRGHHCERGLCVLGRCGDGVRDEFEECDDGNNAPDDGCSATCRIEYCGNGLREGDEQCDDGNNAQGDGCTPDCRSTRGTATTTPWNSSNGTTPSLPSRGRPFKLSRCAGNEPSLGREDDEAHRF